MPAPGDVVVTRSSGRVEHHILFVPDRRQGSYANHTQAVDQARALAQQMHVDAWLTEDHIHFLRIASHRAPGR